MRRPTRVCRRALPDVILLAQNAVDAKLPFVGANGWPPTSSARRTTPRNHAAISVSTKSTRLVALEEADFIVSAGNGVSDIGAFERLAGAFGAAIGAKPRRGRQRPLHARQTGRCDRQDGRASVYIAFGISGAVQHLRDQDCRHVIAVNLDGSAPIAKRANLTVVGDAQGTIAALIEQVQAARAAWRIAGRGRHP